MNRELHLDTQDGRIQVDPEAMKMWGRNYERGWAPHVWDAAVKLTVPGEPQRDCEY